jgi:hypothetical protein
MMAMSIRLAALNIKRLVLAVRGLIMRVGLRSHGGSGSAARQLDVLV